MGEKLPPVTDTVTSRDDVVVWRSPPTRAAVCRLLPTPKKCVYEHEYVVELQALGDRSAVPLPLYIEFGIVYIFIGARALQVDHGAKSPEKAPFIERFQRSGPSASKDSGLMGQKRSLKRLQTDMLNL